MLLHIYSINNKGHLVSDNLFKSLVSMNSNHIIQMSCPNICIDIQKIGISSKKWTFSSST